MDLTAGDVAEFARDTSTMEVTGTIVRSDFSAKPIRERREWLLGLISQRLSQYIDQIGFVMLLSPQETRNLLPPEDRRVAVIHYREFWGMAFEKRLALVEDTAKAYRSFKPSESKRWKMVPFEHSGGYEEWPSLDDLFPRAFQGVEPNRGLDGSVVDFDAEKLALRIRAYFQAEKWSDIRNLSSELAAPRAGYDPEQVWKAIRISSHFEGENILPYHLFPLDKRFIYHEVAGKLLNRPRPELRSNLLHNEFLNAVPLPRQSSEARPLLSSGLYDRHLHDRGTFGFPKVTNALSDGANLFSMEGPSTVANISSQPWHALCGVYDLEGDLSGDDAKSLVARLFRLALALGHSPRFESDHQESLAQDWLHLPIPKSFELLKDLAGAGDKVAILLDPLTDPRSTIMDLLGDWYSKLAVVNRMPDTTGPSDYTVTYSYFGGSKGRWEPKSAPIEEWPSSWGEQTGDLYLNPTTFLQNVPERIWRYELGGYPVIKKWLGYRDAKRRPGKPLTQGELGHLRSIVQRLAALHILHQQLDELYEQIGQDCFTAEELGLRKVSSQTPDLSFRQN